MKWLKRIAILLAVLIFVPLIVLLAMGHRASAGRGNTAIEINASPEHLSAWIDDSDKLKQWVSWLVEVKYPDPQKTHGAGAKRVLVMKDENNGGMLINIAGTCSEYAPPSRMTIHLSDAEGIFDGDETYQLVDLGGGRTRMEIHGRFHYSQRFANLMEPLITPQAEKKMAMDVAHLKILVESQAVVR
jgi:hypothetical protein